MSDCLSQRLSDVRERIDKACLRAGRLAGEVRLIAVTKGRSAETVQKLIDLGVRNIGENRVQEIDAKASQLIGEFVLHMIGHLQTNKARKVWPLVKWIQSIDREDLVQKLESLYGSDGVEAAVCAPPAFSHKKKVLVEVNTTGEVSKTGCSPSDCRKLCEAVAQSNALELGGLMTMGPLDGDERAIRQAFAQLRELSQKCCIGIAKPELSMGMSGDFEWAVEEGATMVRIGTILVGDST